MVPGGRCHSTRSVFRFLKDEVTIGLDTSGVSLHKRGYRKLTAKAPITETLAAALIMLTPWKGDRILVDPFCGSGTFPIEAAMMAVRYCTGSQPFFPCGAVDAPRAEKMLDGCGGGCTLPDPERY